MLQMSKNVQRKSAQETIEENETKVEQNVNTFPLKIMSHKVRAITVTLGETGAWLVGVVKGVEVSGNCRAFCAVSAIHRIVERNCLCCYLFYTRSALAFSLALSRHAFGKILVYLLDC